MFLIIAEHFHAGKGACPVYEIATSAKVQETLVQSILEKFKSVNLVYEVEGDTRGYLPARALDTITLDTLIASVDEDLAHHFSDVIESSPELTQVFEKIQRDQIDGLKNTTVSSLLDDID